MPKVSKRKRLLQIILSSEIINILCENNNTKLNEHFYDSITYFSIINSRRYLDPRNTKVPKSSDWYLNILPHYDDHRFRCTMRVSRNEFTRLYEMLRHNKVFQNHGTKPTLSVELQIAISLYRFGCNGTGSSFTKVGQQFGVSDGGMIRNATDHTIRAILDLESEYIKWPSEQERKEIVAYMENKLPNCIGYLDGCHIPLYEAPSEDHESYFSRKQQYAMHLQCVCDNNLVIRQVTLGYPASVHDARVFSNSPISKQPRQYLSCEQWIAADSAYKLTEFILTPFRDNSKVGTKTQRKMFNLHFSGYRVKIEQTFGICKNVWGSLKSLRIKVDKNKGHKRACEWILACCILYNIIKPNVSEYDLQNHDQQECDAESIECPTQKAESKRESLMQWISS